MKRLISATVSLLGIAAIIGTCLLAARTPLQMDASSFDQNSLPPSIQNLLQQMTGEIIITPNVDSRPELKDRIHKALEPYQHAKPNIRIDWESWSLASNNTSLNSQGELILHYGKHRTIARSLKPEILNQAFLQLSQGEAQWLGFLQTGKPFTLDSTEHDGFARLDQLLKQQGYQRFSIDPAQPTVPGNIDVLIVRATNASITPELSRLIRHWLDAGKPMLWLQESKPDLEARLLLAELGLTTLKGILVDADGTTRESLGLRHPAVITGHASGKHLLSSLKGPALFPVAQSLVSNDNSGWNNHVFLQSSETSWNETGEMSGKIHFDETTEQQGPLVLATALERIQNTNEQRIVVIGDSDFLNNDYLGYASNSGLILSTLRWLSGNDVLLESDTRTTPDAQLDLSQQQLTIIAAVWLILVPVLLLLIAVRLWYLRRHA